MEQLTKIPGKLIYRCIHGSKCYGLDTEESDTDYKGIYIADPKYYLGFNLGSEQKEISKDEVIFELRKFIRLLVQNNPTLIEVLWVEDRFWTDSSYEHELLRKNRELFLTKKVKNSFGGYGAAQLHRIKQHRSWLLHPVEKQPQREDFFLTKEVELTKDIKGAINAMSNEAKKQISSSIMEVYERERAYDNALKNWQSYQDWKKSRNPRRAEIEAKYGYDCYTIDTEFLTEEGWKTYKDISLEERVGTINQGTHQVEFQIPTSRIKKSINDSIIHIENELSRCFVTKHHRILVSEIHRSKRNLFSTKYTSNKANWEFKTAIELITGKKAIHHIISTPSISNKEKEIPVVGKFEGDNLLRLIGAFVSEGCFAKYNKEKQPSTIRISQKVGGRLCNIMSFIESNFRKYLYDTEIIWTLSDKKVVEFLFNKCKNYAEKKRLPEFCRFLSIRQLNILLDALIAGDGTDRGENRAYIYYTKSKLLADDIQAACTYSGRYCKILGPYNNLYFVEIKKLEQNYQKTTLARWQNIIKEESYKGEVVCFTVPNEMLITRNRGKIAIQGNCKHAMHLVRLLKMAEEILSTKEVQVFRKDRDELLSIRNGSLKYEELISWADKKLLDIESAYNKSSLPTECDEDKITNLVIELVKRNIK